MAPVESKGPRVLQGVLVGLLMASAGVNLLQAERLWETMGPQPSPASAVGRAVPDVDGYAPDGRRVSHRMRDGRPTVLYYFASTCAWCQRNWDNLNALTQGTEGRFRILAVTAERNMAGDVAKHRIQAEVVEGVPAPILASFGFQNAPHLVVVSPEGVVSAEWLGAPTPRMERQIEAAFDVLLPGLSPATRLPLRAQ
jgi:hypothetical protein